MPIDSVFDYLRACGGADTLVFDTPEAASKARDLIKHQLAEDDVVFDLCPSLDIFENTLRMRLKEIHRVTDATKQAAEVF